MDEEPLSAAAEAAAAFWTALGADDDALVEKALSPRALTEVGMGEMLGRRVRDVLGVSPGECRHMAVLNDVPLKGFVDIGGFDDVHRIDYMIADLVDDVNDERLMPGPDAAMTRSWTLDVMLTNGTWYVDWEVQL